MITEYVTFELPSDMSRGQVLALYKQTAPGWRQNPDLLRKTYLFDEANRIGGGVYLWRTLEAAQRWHGAAWRERVKERFGNAPTVRYFETPLVVDNVAGQTVEAEALA